MQNVAELVIRARVGDKEAYDAICLRFQSMALSYAYSILGDYDLAEDAKQEAFIDAYCDLMALREPAAFPGWFRKIVLKHSVNIQRGKRLLTVPLESAAEPVSREHPADRIVERKETKDAVTKAIDALPAAEGEATRLYYLEELSIKEIGRRTHTPDQTIKSRLHSARARLRQRLMKMANKTVRDQQGKGDNTARDAATAEAVAQFDTELQSLLKYPSESQQQRAVHLLCAKGRLHRFMGRMHLALSSFEQGMSIPVVRDSAVSRARFRAEMGLTYLQMSDYARARAALQTSHAALRNRRGQDGLLAAVLNGQGMCAWGKGEFRKARGYYGKAIVASRKADCGELEAEARNNLALLDWKSGRLGKALENFRLSLKCWKKIKNRFARALTMMNIGIIEENMGRYPQAKRRYREALALAEEVDFVQVQAATHGNLANLALVQKHWRLSLEHSTRSLELADKTWDRRSQAIALENQALAYIQLQEPESARRAVERALGLAKAIGDKERVLSLELVEIEDLLARKELDGVFKRLEAARKALVKGSYLAEFPRLLRLKAHAEIYSGKKERARTTLRQAMHECEKQKNDPERKRLRSLGKLLPA